MTPRSDSLEVVSAKYSMAPEGKPSKVVPCVVCGDLCEVHAYAATKWVKCPLHMKSRARAARRSTTLDPFEPGLDLETRQQRIFGTVLTLRRRSGGVEWDEVVTATGLRSFDEETGVIECFAYGGSARPLFDKDRGKFECGQFKVFERGEVVSCR